MTSSESSIDQQISIPLEASGSNILSVDREDRAYQTNITWDQVEGSKLVATDITSGTFVSQWGTSETSSGSSNSRQIRLPLESSGTYNFNVDWGDLTSSTITSWDQAEVTHTYAEEGVYTIAIDGTWVGWRFYIDGDRLKIIEISQWGDLQLGNSTGYFYGSRNLWLTATDVLNLTGTSTLSQAFYQCTNLGNRGNFNNWNVSSVTNMYEMFSESSFNQPISDWDVSSVTDMGGMFSVSSFNQPIGNWNVSSVTHMQIMFSESSFNQPIGDWDVSAVTSIVNMFHYASSFNPPINNWDVSSVTDMKYMFRGAFSFNQPIGNWNVSSVSSMFAMFAFVTLSTSNYDNLLEGWAALSLQYSVNFGGGYSQYSNHTARQYIMDIFDWRIDDGGLAGITNSVDSEISKSKSETSEINFLQFSIILISITGVPII